MSRFARRTVDAVVVGALAVAVILAGTGAASGLAAPVLAADEDRVRSSTTERVASSMPESPLVAQQVDADNTLLRAELGEDGDARWTVEYRVRLETDNETQAFQTIVDDVESNPENFTSRFGDRMRATARAAENATGREMEVRNVTVNARIQEVPKFGIVTYTFEWTNFAAVDGNKLIAGDALSGLFLDSGTRLVIAWPEGYERTAVTPEPTKSGDRSVEWAGPTEFTSGEPRVAAAPAGPLSGNGLLVAGAGAVVVVGLAAIVLWRRRSGTAPEPAGRTDTGGAASEPVEEAAATAGNDDGESEPPEELLSNEERVLKVMREHGGRMKQQEVVEALGWTEAKTSQVVRSLREDGELEGFRLGRENVLRLPEVDEAAGGDDDGDENA